MQDKFINIPEFLTDVASDSLETSTASANCATLCEISCQGCQTGCEAECQAYCDTYCQSVCQTHCQSCEGECQNSLEKCGDCEVVCTSGECNTCEKICQKNCEKVCETNCELYCTAICECTNEVGGCQMCQSESCGDCQTINQVTPGSDPYVDITGVTATSITAKVKGMSATHAYSRTYKWYLDGVYKGQNTSEPKVSESPSFTFSDLKPGTTYTIKAVIVLFDGSTVTKQTQETTLQETPSNAYIDTYSITETSITAKVKGMSATHAYSRTYKWYLNGTYKGENSSAAYTSESPAYTFSGLKSGTTYTIKAVIVLFDGSTIDVETKATTIQSAITKWSWSFSTSPGAVCAVPAKEWLKFCEKINEVRNAHGLSAYAFTTSAANIAAGKPLYLWIFKQAVTALDDLNSGVSLTACKNIVSGDKVKGSYFDTLENAVNAAIDKI